MTAVDTLVGNGRGGGDRKRLRLTPDLRVEYRLRGDPTPREVAVRPRVVIEFESEFEMSFNAIFGLAGRTEHVPWMVWKQEHPGLKYPEFVDALEPGMVLLVPDDDEPGDDGDEPEPSSEGRDSDGPLAATGG